MKYLLFIICSYLAGCSYKSYDEVNPPENRNDCDTTAVTYTKSIAPMVNQYCIKCHGSRVADAAGASVVLDNYENMKTYAQTSYTTVIGVNYRMPLGGPKLDTCNILKLKKWIDSGKLQ